MHVLMVGATETLPAGVDELLAADNWHVDRAPDVASASSRARRGGVDAVVLAAGDDVGAAQCESFLRWLESIRVPVLVVGGAEAKLPVAEGTLIDLAGADVSKEEITRRLATLTRFHGQLRRIEQELEHMQQLGSRLHQHFSEIDEELRLASRLQQDFLPREIDRIGPLRFGTLYRPASWVSGDMFDIQRIDETHIGFYIIDAVGHGMAAGLLTMFVKRAMITKRVDGAGHEVLNPDESLKLLNDALSQYALPNCQFITGLYCLFDTRSYVLRYARGGHPYPLLIGRDGRATELKSPGGLMGLFPGFECSTGEVRLHPGDKVVLFTDGLEEALWGAEVSGGDGFDDHQAVLVSLAGLTVDQMTARLSDRLDRQQGSLLPSDDVTVLAMEVVDNE